MTWLLILAAGVAQAAPPDAAKRAASELALAATFTSSAACVSSLTEDAFSARLAHEGLSQPTVTGLQVQKQEMIRVLACAGFSVDDPGVCDVMDVPGIGVSPGGFTPAYYCRTAAKGALFDRARLTGEGDVYGRCVADNQGRLPKDEGPFKADRVPDVCRVLADFVAGKRDLAAACKDLAPMMRGEVDDAACRKRLTFGFGLDPEVCATLKSEFERTRCGELVAFHKAWAAKSPVACGDFPHCRMLMQPKRPSCDSRVLRDTFCGLLTSPDHLSKLRVAAGTGK